MTDAQLISISITVLAIVAGALINNSRITDIKEVLRAEMQALEARMDLRFSAIDHKLDEMLRILGNHETRLTAL